MTWGSSFINSLDNASAVVRYELRFYQLPTDSMKNSGGVIRETGVVAISDEEIEIQGVSVVPQTWGVTFGGFTIYLTGDLRPISSGVMRKGNVATLNMIRDHLAPERVCIGQLVSVSGVRDNWRLEFVDLLTMIYARLSMLESKQPFYYNAGRSTTVSSNFNFGTSPLLNVADISIFEKDASSTGKIKVVQGGSTDYWTWSGISAGKLVITSTGNYPGDTNLPAVVAGAEVTNVARLLGKPQDIIGRTLASIAGDYTYGRYDSYPASYGANVIWGTEVFDWGDALWWYNNVLKPSSVDLFLDLLFEAPATEGFRALLDKYAVIGLWPCWRQNQMTIRGALDLSGPIPSPYRINDRDIIEILQHEIYSPNQSVTYQKTRYLYHNGSAAASLITTFHEPVTLPAADLIERNAADIILANSDAQQNILKILDRVRNWDRYPYEELTLAVVERFAVLVAGDHVTITSSMIYGFQEAEGKTYQGARAMVLSTVWRPKQRNVILTLGVGVK